MILLVGADQHSHETLVAYPFVAVQTCLLPSEHVDFRSEQQNMGLPTYLQTKQIHIHIRH